MYNINISISSIYRPVLIVAVLVFVLVVVWCCTVLCGQATCLQTMHDHLLKASQYVAEMKCAFSSIKEEHE